MHQNDCEASVARCRLAAEASALCPEGRRALALRERKARVVRLPSRISRLHLAGNAARFDAYGPSLQSDPIFPHYKKST